jgi:hypothetical protein
VRTATYFEKAVDALHETSFFSSSPGVIDRPSRVAVRSPSYFPTLSRFLREALVTFLHTASSPGLIIPLSLFRRRHLHPPDQPSRKWVVCSPQMSTINPRRVSLIVVNPLFPVLVLPYPWFELHAVGGEGYSYQLYPPHVHTC